MDFKLHADLQPVGYYPIHPDMSALFATYGDAFAPWTYKDTTPGNKTKMGISLADHQPLIDNLLACYCTQHWEISLIYTLVCLAVELGNEGYLDIKPWGPLICKFGSAKNMCIGKAYTLSPRCTWFSNKLAPRGFVKKPFIIATVGDGMFPSWWLGR